MQASSEELIALWEVSRTSAGTPEVAKVRRGGPIISPDFFMLKRTVICMPSRAASVGGGDQHERSSAKRSPVGARLGSGFLYLAPSSLAGTLWTVSCRFSP